MEVNIKENSFVTCLFSVQNTLQFDAFLAKEKV